MITRTVKKHLETSDKDLEAIAQATIIKKEIGELEAWHCCSCGIIYKDKNYSEPIIDILLLTGKYHLPKPFNNYNITSGLCNPCFNSIMEKKN